MKTLYKFNCDCGRMGELSGVFVSTPERVEAVIGKTVHFGEALGKHSEIDVDLEASEIEKVTSNEIMIDVFEKCLNSSVSHNPIARYEEWWEEDGQYQDEE